MDNFVYNSIGSYFHTLETLGYCSDKKAQSLLVLIFYYNLIYHDYRGYISKEDYSAIEKALDCLYGTNCLIPYPDYLKMEKLKLGGMTEVLTRVKTVENKVSAIESTKVIKSKDYIQDIPSLDIEAFGVIAD